MSLTLGSLFDGIGGFPLAGIMNGITPVWASEIEPFPLKVTAARFPEMKQRRIYDYYANVGDAEQQYVFHSTNSTNH